MDWLWQWGLVFTRCVYADVLITFSVRNSALSRKDSFSPRKWGPFGASRLLQLNFVSWIPSRGHIQTIRPFWGALVRAVDVAQIVTRNSTIRRNGCEVDAYGRKEQGMTRLIAGDQKISCANSLVGPENEDEAPLRGNRRRGDSVWRWSSDGSQEVECWREELPDAGCCWSLCAAQVVSAGWTSVCLLGEEISWRFRLTLQSALTVDLDLQVEVPNAADCFAFPTDGAVVTKHDSSPGQHARRLDLFSISHSHFFTEKNTAGSPKSSTWDTDGHDSKLTSRIS